MSRVVSRKKQERGEEQRELLIDIAGTATSTLKLTSHFPNLSNSSTRSFFFTFLEMFPTNKLIFFKIFSLKLLYSF